MLPLVFRKKKKSARLLKSMDLVGVKVLFESAVIHLWKNVLHRSMLLSDHVLLDIPYKEGLMFNIKFTYL